MKIHIQREERREREKKGEGEKEEKVQKFLAYAHTCICIHTLD